MDGDIYQCPDCGHCSSHKSGQCALIYADWDNPQLSTRCPCKAAMPANHSLAMAAGWKYLGKVA